MFYKDRSTVLGRIGPKAHAHAAKDDTVLEMAEQLVEGSGEQQAMKKPKLSAFERELLQAWGED